MCGFLGFTHNEQHQHPRLIDACNMVRWRGKLIGSYQTKKYFFFSSRLARTGNLLRPQPIVLPDGSVLVLNGEVYNIRELCQAYLVSFKEDRSDAELFAQVLNKTNDRLKLLSEIIGEYALAYFDFESSQILLARDHFGTKPLFYCLTDKQFFFGSSAKALSILLSESPEIDWMSAQDILEFGVTVSGNVFKHIVSLQAGESIILNENGSVSRRSIPFCECKELDIQSKLTEAIHTRYVPGRTALAFSGGVDSSLIRALCPTIPAYRIMSQRSMPLKGEIPVRPQSAKIIDEAAKMLEYADRPMCSLSSVAMHIMAKSMRDDGMENMITGEGADELFSGYPHQFSDSTNGHPILKQHSTQFSLATALLDVKFPAHQSSSIANLLLTNDASAWCKFDRNVRLPQHLTLSHSDMPGLLAGIEARYPFIDFCIYPIRNFRKMKRPKEELLNTLHKVDSGYCINKNKSGLNLPFSTVTDKDLLEFTRAAEDIDNTGSMQNLTAKIEKVLRNNYKIAMTYRKASRELTARLVWQLSSLSFLVKIYPSHGEILQHYTKVEDDCISEIKNMPYESDSVAQGCTGTRNSR